MLLNLSKFISVEGRIVNTHFTPRSLYSSNRKKQHFLTDIKCETLQASKRRGREAFLFSINTTLRLSQNPSSSSIDLVVHTMELTGQILVIPSSLNSAEDTQPIRIHCSIPDLRKRGQALRKVLFTLGSCKELFIPVLIGIHPPY